MTQPAKVTPWSGRKVTSARTYWLPRLPLPCYLCGKPVTKDQRWVVEHIVPRSHGGNPTLRSNQWVSHRGCSDSSGGVMGAAITHARASETLTTNVARNIRGV